MRWRGYDYKKQRLRKDAGSSIKNVEDDRRGVEDDGWEKQILRDPSPAAQDDNVGALQMQVFHGGGAEDDEDAYHEAGFLEGDGLNNVLFFFLFVFVARGLDGKDDGIQKQGQNAQDQREFNKKDGQIFGIMGQAVAGLHFHEFSHVMQVDAAGEEDHQQQDADHLAILLVEGVANRFDVFPGNGRLEPRRHRQDQKGKSSNPNNGRE